jgi:hypothetical protein
MAERFFTKVANDVLEASEQLSNRLEEGIATILNGDLAPKQHAQEDQQQQQQGPPHDDQFEIDEEELRHNPLQGMAESLVGDIMSGQVRTKNQSDIWALVLLLERYLTFSLTTTTFAYIYRPTALKRRESTLTPSGKPLDGRNPLFWHWQLFNSLCFYSVCGRLAATLGSRLEWYSCF